MQPVKISIMTPEGKKKVQNITSYEEHLGSVWYSGEIDETEYYKRLYKHYKKYAAELNQSAYSLLYLQQEKAFSDGLVDYLTDVYTSGECCEKIDDARARLTFPLVGFPEPYKSFGR